MAKMIRLHRDGQEIAINTDLIKSLEHHPSKKGTLINFIKGDPMDVDESLDVVSNRINVIS